MKKVTFVSVIILMLLLSVVMTVPLLAQDSMETQVSTVHRFADASEIDGAEASLTRMEHGVSMVLNTVELEAGDAVTVWWIVFNAPENCSDGMCGEDDIFMMDENGEFILPDDGSPPANPEGREAAMISAMRADGHVIDEGGAAWFQGHLPIGDTSEAIWGPGLLDAMTAEIHLVVRVHGAAIPGEIDAMINTVNGGCESTWPFEPCEDVQFAVFMPPM